MSSKASITVLCPPDEAERLWHTDGYRPEHIDQSTAVVSFVPAPGDRGTEIHVDLRESAAGGRIGEAIQKVRGTEPVAKANDDLRRFKQRVETGVIAVSDGVPEGEALERKLKQRPAQPLPDEELQKVGA